MKNLKKILALAVAFVMCFTMFAGAATFTDVTLGGDYSQAITFLSDLGVIAGKPDGSFGVNDAITRADAACLIARLMTGQPTPQKYDGHIAFTDVPAGSYYETSVGYCAALGITVGKGNGRFAPMDTITDGEFIAMLTRALGYDTAEHPLAFPMGNITQAQARGLLDGVKVEYASDALRGEDAQMLYNALFAEYDRAAANKNLYQGSDDHWNVTIAEEAFGLGRLSHDTAAQNDNSGIGRRNNVSFHGANRNNNPVVSCDSHTWVIAGVDARYEENTYVAFAIDDDDVKAIDPEEKDWSYQLFTYSGDIKPLLGYRVELWGEYDHSNPVWDVTAIKVVDGNLAGARASTAGFESRYDANQAVYSYQPGMDDDDDTVTIDGKELYINKNGNVVNNAKINLDINESSRWMWATENAQISAAIGNIPSAIYAGFNNTFADNGPYVDNGYPDAYRLASVTASDSVNPDPESNTLVKLNFRDGDRYTLFDWDGDDKIDFVVTDTAKYAEVASKTSTRMVLEADDRTYTSATARARGQYALKLDDDNLKVEGADGIEEGDIVEITVVSRVYDRADREVVTIKLEKVDPEVKKLEKINVTRGEYTFDGEVVTAADLDLFDRVELSEGGDSIDQLNTIENIGKEFNLWFDRNGFLLKARVNDDSASGYLMILETLDGQDNLHTSVTASKRGLALADVLFDDNTVGEEVEFVKNLSINGSTTNNGYNSSTREWNERMVVGNVYKYYMNEDGQISRLTSMTDYQGANYSFDDSKDRLNAVARDTTVTGSTQSARNYGFEDDAVIFAVRSKKTDDDGVEDVDGDHYGYIRVKDHTDSTSVKDTPHFWVDPADVMAVSIDDVPEIDNRFNNTTPYTDVVIARNGLNGVDRTVNWTTPAYEVTHPSRFITWDLNKGAAYNVSSFANFAGGTDGARWMAQTAAANWNTADDVYASVNQANGANIASAGSTTPAVAFNLNNKGTIDAAIFGVDSLDFFGASSVKLALISNVYATGNKTWEFQAAIDGKYDTFKTVKNDEDKIFKGYIGDSNTANSYAAMRSYLDLNVDSYTGRRNALYAEVVMDKDGQIREVRAMREMAGNSNGTTYWGDDPIGSTIRFYEGSVYRVIRGVATQLRSGNYVTWQSGVVAANGDALYSLSEYDDRNGYDHLEAAWDEDTDFYAIDQKPRMATDVRVQVTDGFRSDIDGDVSVKDSGMVEASSFVGEADGADYRVYDFAVYKNNMDKLSAVFGFKKVTNGTALATDSVDGLTATRGTQISAQTAGVGTAADPETYTFAVDASKVNTFNYTAGNDLTFTFAGKMNGKSFTEDVIVDPTDAGVATAAPASLTSVDIAKMIEYAISQLTGDAADAIDPAGTVTRKNLDVTFEGTVKAPEGSKGGTYNRVTDLTISPDLGAVVSTTAGKDGVDGTTNGTYASTEITIPAGNYRLDAGKTMYLSVTLSGPGASSGGVVRQVIATAPAYSNAYYDASDIASMVASVIDSLNANISATNMSGNSATRTIVVTDRGITAGNKLNITNVTVADH